MKEHPILSGSLNVDSDVPLYSQLVNMVKRLIASGVMVPGDLLPSESELCKVFQISRSTVRQAVGSLESEGLVVRKQGKGTFVADPNMRRRTDNVYSFTSEISAMGLVPSSSIIDYEIINSTPEISKILELHEPDIKIYKFTRLRKVNDEPLILETSYYPVYIYPKLTRELLETHSFYSLLYEVGVMPFSAVDTYEVVKFSKKEAELLDCKPGSCGFYIQRLTRSESGELYECTRSLMRGDRTKLDVVLHKDGVSFSRRIDTHLNEGRKS